MSALVVPMSADIARLRWRCRRGMRELDAVLRSFVDSELAALNGADFVRFERILDLPDPELLAYLTGRSAPADLDIARLIDRVRTSHRPHS